MKVVGEKYSYDDSNDDDVLGEGSFGIVYRGHDKDDPNKTVAIKSLSLNKSVFRRVPPEILERETAILKELSSNPNSNLVSLLLCVQTTTHIYMVMEFCNGGDLLDYLAEKKKLDETTLKRFLLQIAAGLKILHERKIIHRDLKPENILLNFQGKRYPDPKDITLKLADFGVGRFLPEGAMAETFCGTYNYMAPEVRKHYEYDYKVDLWSVGAIVYQSVADLQLNSPPDIKSPRFRIPGSISKELKSLLEGLLAPEPSRRFDCKMLLGHPFLGETIGVSVRGPGGNKMIHLNQYASVDDLVSKVSHAFGLGSEPGALYLIHDGRQLEQGHPGSLRDNGILHGSTIEFCQRVRGGGKEAGNRKDGN